VSWKTINRILGRACIDHVFWQALQLDPQATLKAEGFELTPEEEVAFEEFAQLPFSEFCQHLLEVLAPDKWY
jgi:hypothetical protein